MKSALPATDLGLNHPENQAAPAHSSSWAGDLWGALAAMLVSLPSAIAYGAMAYGALGPAFVSHGVLAGIFGAILLGAIAPALGGAPRLISAPCAPAAAVLTAFAAQAVAPSQLSPDKVLALISVMALLSAALQLFYGAIGGGRLIKFIPYPVVSGYLSGVGALIFISQLPKFFGFPKHTSSWEGLLDVAHWNHASLIIGSATIVAMLLAPRLTRKCPAPIFGLAGGILAYWAMSAFDPALRTLAGNHFVIGHIGVEPAAIVASLVQRGEAFLGLQLADLKLLLFHTITLSILLSIDTLKTCVVVDAITRSRHQSNRELMAQGTGNLVSALAGGMPGAGTMGATLVNLNSGALTRRSGILEGVFVAAAFLLLGRFIAWTPVPALAGIMIVIAFRMVDWHTVHLLRSRHTVLDFLVIAAVIGVAIGVNLIAAAGVGVGLAILLFVREQIQTSVLRRKIYGSALSSRKIRLPSEKEALAQAGPTSVICELQGSLFFGTSDRLFTQLETDLRHCRFLILDMRRVQSVDYTAAHLLELFQGILREQGACLIFSNLPASLPTGQNLQAYFDQVGVMKPSSNIKIFPELEDALEWTEDRILEQQGFPQNAAPPQPLSLGEFDLLRDFDSGEPFLLLQNCVAERSVPSGQLIFHQGDLGDELFLIRSGTVRIQLPLSGQKHYTLACFGPGNFFGEMAFLDHGARSADAIAATAAELYVIPRARFDAASKANPVLGVKIFARLARTLAIRLRYTDAEMRGLQEA